MYTLNFYKLYADFVVSDRFYGKMGLKMYDGADKTYFSSGVNPCLFAPSSTAYPSNMNNVLTSISNSYGGVVFGTGRTPPTVNDYKLEGDIISTVVASIAVAWDMDDSGFSVTATYTITNTGSDEITIGEVGLLASSGGGANNKVLVERTVLDSPVTIEPGGVGQVVYTIGMDFPTA